MTFTQTRTIMSRCANASGLLATRKKALRSEMRAKLKQLTTDQAKEESRSIARTLLESALFAKARSVGLYVSSPRLKEVQTEELIEACIEGKKVCYVPKVNGAGNMQMLQITGTDDLVPAPPYNIPEPKEIDAKGEARAEAMDKGLDLFIIPGVAFDTAGRRLGRGAGYYDIYLEKYLIAAAELSRPKPKVVALSFSCQMVSEVPCEDHDMRMDAILTPDELFDCENVVA